MPQKRAVVTHVLILAIRVVVLHVVMDVKVLVKMVAAAAKAFVEVVVLVVYIINVHKFSLKVLL